MISTVSKSWALTSFPNRYPRVSTILTTVFAVLFLLGGVALVVSGFASTGSATPNQQALIFGGILSAVGAVLLGLVINAICETNWFRNWQGAAIGDLGHPIVRWFGPITLFVLLFLIILALWLRQFQRKR